MNKWITALLMSGWLGLAYVFLMYLWLSRSLLPEYNIKGPPDWAISLTWIALVLAVGATMEVLYIIFKAIMAMYQ